MQEQRYIPKGQPQAQVNRNQIQPPQANPQPVPVSKSKVRLKKVYLWFRENFFPIISDNDSDSEDEDERQAIKQERKLMKNPPIIKSELRVRFYCNVSPFINTV